MALTSLRSLAVANLGKSHDFLTKVLDVCRNFPGGIGSPADRDVVTAIAELAKLTQAIMQGAEAGQPVSDLLAAAPLGPSERENDVRRQRIILELCLQQAEQNRLNASQHREEGEKLRRELKQLAADLARLKAALAQSRKVAE